MSVLKKKGIIMAVVVCLSVCFGFSTTVFASEQDMTRENQGYLTVNGQDKIYVGEDYNNPITGEYFHWNSNARGGDKTFSFKIHTTVSSNFTVYSDKVLVTATAHMEDIHGNVVPGYGHLYSVEIRGWYGRRLQFSVGNTQSGTITGLKSGSSYELTVTNDEPVTGDYLVGSGSVRML